MEIMVLRGEPPLGLVVVGLGREWWNNPDVKLRVIREDKNLVATASGVPMAQRDAQSCLQNQVLLRPLLKRMRMHNSLDLPYKFRLEEQLKVFFALKYGYENVNELTVRKITFSDDLVNQMFLMASGLKKMLSFLKRKFNGEHCPRDRGMKSIL